MGVHMATWVWFTFVLLLLGGTSGPSSWTHHNHHPYQYQYACHAQQQEERRHIVQKPLLDPVPVLPQVTHKVYLDIELSSSTTSSSSSTTDQGSETNDKSVLINSGRIVLGLFGTNAPQLVENFITFCDCTHPSHDPTLCYRGSIFHRVIPNFMIQGGDTTHFDGTGGTTIYAYDATKGGALEHTITTTDQFLPRGDIPDENLSSIPLNRKYLLASANRGYRNSNTSQFFITTVKTQWLNGHHVVFGVVLDGEDVIQLIEAQGTNGGIPKQRITIVQTGSLELTTQDQIPIPVARREAFPKFKRPITTVPQTHHDEEETVDNTK